MMRLVRRAGIAGLAGLTAAVAVGALASAHVVKYPTGSLSVRYTSSDDPASDETDYFSGNVSANKRACMANRGVVVYSDAPGVDVEVGSDRTTGGGEWRIFAEDIAAGSYYAAAERKTLKLTVDHRHICQAVRSDSLQAGP
jgi:hypothetical protein